MLCCPKRSRSNFSNRLPGGDLKNSKVTAASNIVNFRVATFKIAENLELLPVSNN